LSLLQELFGFYVVRKIVYRPDGFHIDRF